MRTAGEYGSTIRGGRRAGRRNLVVHVADAERGAEPRVGFVVSRAVGGSVVRNRVKRRLRHLCADRLEMIGGDLVVRALPPSATATYAELGRDLDAALDRVGAR